jgi:uncharacterized protein (TIGR04255 family)
VAGITLKNPPLIEAIFEIKWQLEETGGGLKQDPHYSLLIGRIYDRLDEDYPFHQRLPSASMPSEMVAGIVQHRFRRGEEQWPLIQIGPGVFTVNDTKGYTWVDFEKRIIQGVSTLCEVYPDAQNLTIDSLMLRYINGLEFDFDKEDILQFLAEQMKVDVSFHPSLFDHTDVERRPLGLDCNFTFTCEKPRAVINLRFAKGQRRNANALIWQTNLVTRSDDVPNLPTELEDWLENAHDVIEDWFFKTIEGDLLKRFK